MSKQACCSDDLIEDNEYIIKFKPCEMFKEVDINVDMECETDEYCCNSPDKMDDKFIMALVCSILKQLNLKCRKHRHKHHKHKHHKNKHKHNHYNTRCYYD